MPRNSARASIVATPGVATSSGAPSASGTWAPGDAPRRLDVGVVVAVLTAHQLVLTRLGRREEAGGLFAAHDPGLGLDEVDLEPAALEDPLVGCLVAVEARVETGLVAIERVGVLHDELAHPEEPAAGPWLVALLRAEVVPELWQLLVRLDLTGVKSHRLLV